MRNCFSYQSILAHSAIPEPLPEKCRWEWAGDERDKTRMGNAPFLFFHLTWANSAILTYLWKEEDEKEKKRLKKKVFIDNLCVDL